MNNINITGSGEQITINFPMGMGTHDFSLRWGLGCPSLEEQNLPKEVIEIMDYLDHGYEIGESVFTLTATQDYVSFAGYGSKMVVDEILAQFLTLTTGELTVEISEKYFPTTTRKLIEGEARLTISEIPDWIDEVYIPNENEDNEDFFRVEDEAADW